MKNVPEITFILASIYIICFAPKIIIDIFALLCLFLIIMIVMFLVLDKKDDKNDTFK